MTSLAIDQNRLSTFCIFNMNFVDFLCYFAFGSLFFPLMNLVTTFLVRRIDNQIDESSVSDISVKLVSAFHGILGCIIGVAIMSSCKNDIIHSRNWLTEIYAAFGLSYMVYDVFAMYVTHILDNPQIKKWQLHKRIYHYIHKNKLILLHHTGLPFIYVPVIFYFRNGKGDFFIGTFFTMEMAVPCISFRWIMLRLGRTDVVQAK
ncbi:TLC domain-containing protein 3A-like [Tubulanus polymorphus]|uniref:TLC domain-containing protein 3A-like n=1 Tax=Tubulanus polymorphus TaxID=672921 RepID=UPI003DA6ACCC